MRRDKGREQASASQIESFNYFLRQRALGRSVYARMARLALSLDYRSSAPERFRGVAAKLLKKGKIGRDAYRMHVANIAALLTLHKSQSSREIMCTREGGWVGIGDGCHHRRLVQESQKLHP